MLIDGEDHPGVRERVDKIVRELVLDDPAPFIPLMVTKRDKQVDYEAKSVELAGRRYIDCRNHQEVQKDAADRASILAALQRRLARGDKALIGNTGYRRYLKIISQDHFAIDEAKVQDDAGFDGMPPTVRQAVDDWITKGRRRIAGMSRSEVMATQTRGSELAKEGCGKSFLCQLVCIDRDKQKLGIVSP